MREVQAAALRAMVAAGDARDSPHLARWKVCEARLLPLQRGGWGRARANEGRSLAI
jgi:hypothetical protein